MTRNICTITCSNIITNTIYPRQKTIVSLCPSSRATGWGTSNQSVVDRLTSSADQISGTGSAFKYGRVNAYRAVGGNPPQPPVSSVPNDFSNYAKYIPSLPYSDNESTVGATFGTSEIYCTANPYGASVWYQWTPTTSEWVTANTGGFCFESNCL